ncbi:MAG TPA: TetR/AcrR family transcriptional regulator [Acidimicrobiales bacterium]|nr:TetR/AcrR family transcriptional regulator [Acidimicrobiales bacterium]
MNKRVEQGQATRAALIELATELFATNGYDATAIPAVLDAAGVSRGALYHHFESKEALFEAVLESVEAQAMVKVTRAARGATDPLDGLRRGCSAYLAMCRDPVVRQISLIDAPAVVGWQRWREIDEQHAFGLVKAAIAAIAADGRVKPELVDVMAHMVLAALLEVALLVARADEGRLAIRRGQEAIDELLTALLATGPGDPRGCS